MPNVYAAQRFVRVQSMPNRVTKIEQRNTKQFRLEKSY